MTQKALFLDRDGTINIDRVYINDPKLIELIPKAGEAIALARTMGFLVIVVTNQSGVGRGLIPAENLSLIHKQLDNFLGEKGATIDEYKICIHHPDEACACRKPGIMLVEEAIAKWNISPEESFFIGDSVSDVQAGKRAKCRSILVRTGKGHDSERAFQADKSLNAEAPDFVANDLWEAIQWVSKISSNKD